MIVSAYPGRLILPFKYYQICFPFWRFLRLRNSAWDFFGFLYLAPFDHPCHLKSEVPPPPWDEFSSLLPIVTSSVLMVKDWRDLFKPYPIWARLGQGHRRLTQKLVWHWPENFRENLVPLSTYLSFHLIHPKFLTAFPTKIKPAQIPAIY